MTGTADSTPKSASMFGNVQVGHRIAVNRTRVSAIPQEVHDLMVKILADANGAPGYVHSLTFEAREQAEKFFLYARAWGKHEDHKFTLRKMPTPVDSEGNPTPNVLEFTADPGEPKPRKRKDQANDTSVSNDATQAEATPVADSAPASDATATTRKSGK